MKTQSKNLIQRKIKNARFKNQTKKALKTFNSEPSKENLSALQSILSKNKKMSVNKMARLVSRRQKYLNKIENVQH